MSRPQRIHDDALMAGLAAVFRDYGYNGASMAALSAATGLQKPSLYHRFPGGKREMAEAVLARALDWVGENVVAVLRAPGDPRARVTATAAALEGFYDGGARACLLNMLAAPRAEDGPFTPAIRQAFGALVEAFAAPARDAGADADTALLRAERAVARLQGSLVLARGMGNAGPFRRMLRDLPDEIMGDAR